MFLNVYTLFPLWILLIALVDNFKIMNDCLNQPKQLYNNLLLKLNITNFQISLHYHILQTHNQLMQLYSKT